MKEGKQLPFGGGVDLFGKAFTIGDGVYRMGQNLIHNGDGNLVKRGALTYEGTLSLFETPGTTQRAGDGSGNAILTNKAIWLAVLPFKGGLFAALVAGDERTDFVFGEIIDNIGVTPKTINATRTAIESLPSTFTFGNVLYMVFGPNSHDGASSYAGGSAGIKVTYPPDAPYKVEDFVFSGAGNASLQPRFVTLCRQRAWYANFGVTGDLPNTVLVADVDEPLVLGDNALTDRSFIIGGGDGDKLVAIHTVMLNEQGTPLQTAVLFLKTRHAYLGLGEPTETDDTDYFGTLEISEIRGSGGCISAATVVDTTYGTIWCGPDDVWFLPFRGIPIPIGRHLRPLLLAQPESQRFRCHAVFSGGFYRLALFTDGQGPNHSTPLGEQWWLDLRNGAPSSWQEAKWTGPHVFNVADTLVATRGDDATNVGTSFMAVDPREGHGVKLYGVHYGVTPSSIAWTSTPEAQPVGLNIVVYDSPEVRDIGGLFRTSLQPWVQEHVYEIGEEIVVVQTPADLYPNIFRVTAVEGDAASGSTEPDWELTGTNGVTDNHVTWFRVGTCLAPPGVYGSEIIVDWHSKSYDMKSKMLEKLWIGAEFSVLLGMPERLQLTLVADNGKLFEVITRDVDQMTAPEVGVEYFGGSPAELPTEFTEEYQSIMIQSSEGNRILGKMGQVKLTELPGIYLPDLTVAITIGYAPYSVELTESWYNDVISLATAVANVLNSDAIISAALGSPMQILPERVKINFAAGNPWGPSISTAAVRQVWALLGFTIYEDEATAHNANEMVYDVSIGTLGLAEGFFIYLTNKRRPLP